VFGNKKYLLPYSHTAVYRCCQHNVAFGWPYFAEHLWLATASNGLAAVFYGSSAVEAQVGHGVRVRIEQETAYPFGETVEFTLKSLEPVHFPLLLRVPGWCEGSSVAVNGRALSVEASPRSYMLIERMWKDGDHVTLNLPMKITVTQWAKQANAISVNRGPLSYSLKIGERWDNIGGTDEWPELAVYPTTPWNIGLIVDKAHPAASFELVKRSTVAARPFELDSAPLELHGKGRIIPEWTLAHNSAAPPPPSPVKSDQPAHDVTLVPMGFARLRVSVFPTVG
jgi:hypothetical protein